MPYAVASAVYALMAMMNDVYAFFLTAAFFVLFYLPYAFFILFYFFRNALAYVDCHVRDDRNAK